VLRLPSVVSNGTGADLLEAATNLDRSVESSVHASTYLLIDQSALPNVTSFWSAIDANPWAPILGHRSGQPDGASPLLVDISAVGTSTSLQRLLRTLGDQGRYANCLSLIQSELSCMQLAQSLHLRSAAELPENLAVVFRFFDTRTLPLLPRLLSAEQYAAFVSCVLVWYYVGRNGDVLLLPPAAEFREQTYASPLVFTPEQERMLIDDGVSDAVIDCLLDQRHPALQGLSPPQQFGRVNSLLETARGCGITDILDSLQYCYAAFEHGDGFAASAPWADRWADVRSGRISVEMALKHD
jgi:Domain of unknown function (DUF4123)